MRSHFRFLIVALAAFALVGTLSAAPSVKAATVLSEENLTVSNPVANDGFFSGNSITVNTPVTGELFAAGNTIDLKERVGRSAFLAANSISISKGAAYNVFAAGNTINLDGEFGNDVYVTGNKVVLAESTVIRGNLTIYANEVILAGTINGNVSSNGTTTTSSAIVGGSFGGGNETLTFTGGSIAGNLEYMSDQDAKGLDKVTVAGKTSRSALPRYEQNPVLGVFYAFIATLLLGALLLYRSPRFTTSNRDRVLHHWNNSFGLGLAILILFPIVTLALLFTMVGVKVAFFALALYLLLILIAMVISPLVAGRFLFQKFAAHQAESVWLELLVGAAAIYLVSLIPTLGGIVGVILFFVLFVPSVGSVARGLFTRVETEEK